MDSGRIVFVFTIILKCFIDTSCYVWTREITLAQGKLRGTIDTTKRYKAYLGIPYATVVKRFQEAGPAPVWEGTKDAIDGSIKCNQYSDSSKTSIGQEDCLVANVFTPMKPTNLLPVMVYIHGGGFDTGSNNVQLFNPTYFVQKDVIMVTINYRIGAFGFLCLHEAGAPGNIGLKDAITALLWIKNNIQAFGGDPKSITVFGESAGATAIHYMITTRKYKGLFDKAILQSGSVLMQNKIDLNPIRTASIVASKIGYETEDPKELLKVFQNASADHIIQASRIDAKNQPLKLYRFRPCVESPPIETKSFITKTPKELIETTESDSNISVILGVNNAEGIAQASKYDCNGLETLNSTLSDIIPVNIRFKDESEKEQLTKDIREFYFKTGINYDSLIDYFSDSMIVYSSLASALSLLSSNVAMYNYYFKYDSSRNFYKFKYGLSNKPGASHGDDLLYMFDPVMFDTIPVPPPEGNDLRIINIITELWTNFAKTRNPSSTTIRWIPSKKHNLKFLQLDNEIKMIPAPNRERFQFWDRVYTRYTWN